MKIESSREVADLVDEGLKGLGFVDCRMRHAT